MPVKPPGRWTPLLVLLAVAAAVAGTVMVPWGGECGFRAVLGADCPGCGMTRAVVALLQGRAGDAWRLHPFVFPLVAAALVGVGMAVHEGITGRPTFRRFGERFGLHAAIAGMVLLALVWLLRVVIVPRWAADPVRPGSVAARWLGG